jgi:hypothetical protein
MNIKALAYITQADEFRIRSKLFKKYEPGGWYGEADNYTWYRVTNVRTGTLFYRNIQMDYKFNKKESINDYY